MLFPLRTQVIPAQSFTLGQTIRFTIPRDFFHEIYWLHIPYTMGTAAATAVTEGIYALVQNVRVTVSDGNDTRTIVNCSGRGLANYWAQNEGTLPARTITAQAAYAAGTTGAQVLSLPIPVGVHPSLSGPVGASLLLPAPRFNNDITVEITFGTQANLDSNVSATFAISSATVRLYVSRRSVPANVQLSTFNHELIEYVASFGTSAANQLYDQLPIPGNYTSILLRPYTNNNTPSDAILNGQVALKILDTEIRRGFAADIKDLNDASIEADANTALASQVGVNLDFITDYAFESVFELGSALSVNILQQTGSKLQMILDVNGSSTAQIKFVYHRILGDLSKVQMV